MTVRVEVEEVVQKINRAGAETKCREGQRGMIEGGVIPEFVGREHGHKHD